MTPPASRQALGLLATALLVIAVLAPATRAASAPSLPPVAADALLASVVEAVAGDPTVSGEVVTSAALGLPALPDGAFGTDPGAGPLSLLTGDRRLRVWRSPDGVRLADLGTASERVLIAGADGLWTWDSDTMRATHAPLPDGPGHLDEAHGRVDPLALARRTLAGLDRSTAVSVAATARVADRDAYTLVLRPRDGATLVDRVEIAIDAAERLPLRAAVYGRDVEAPALSAAYTRVSFAPIDPATFTFVPPPGAFVEELAAGPHGDGWRDRRGDGPRLGRIGAPEHLGRGWSTIAVIALPGDGSLPGDRDDRGSRRRGLTARQLRELLPFQGTLFSAQLADVAGGRVLLVGAVPLSALDEAAAGLR